MLRVMVAENPYNAYCVDCLRNQSVYFVMKYGIFVCEPCASVHWTTSKVGKCYLKQVYTE